MLGGGSKARPGFFCLNLIWPQYCYGCQQPGSWLCPYCQQKLVVNWHWRLLSLKSSTALLDIIYCADYHQPLVNKLLKLTKYQRLATAGQILATNLAQFIQQTIGQQLWFQQSLITAVPLSRQRLNWRGFNQAQLLTKAIAKYNHCSIINYWQRQQRPPQAYLNKATRLINLHQAFIWTKPLKGQNIIIIDDIVTTGTTFIEMANCLKQAGANKVRGLALAH